MSFRTIAGSVQDYLGTAIAAQLDAGVPCDVGYPAGGPKGEHVWVTTTTDVDLPRRVSGGKQRDEAGSVIVRILVTMTTSEGKAVRDRALSLAGDVEDAVSADGTFGGLVAEAHVEHIKGQEGIPEERKRQFGVEMTIAYTATDAL